jgi:hypothetical protein
MILPVRLIVKGFTASASAPMPAQTEQRAAARSLDEPVVRVSGRAAGFPTHAYHAAHGMSATNLRGNWRGTLFNKQVTRE